MEAPPSITVIIPTYNRARFVSLAIDSVLAQKGFNVQIIVVDDGSTDNTREVLEVYGNKISAHYQRNAGCGAARNFAIKLATGTWISFLDSDDEWEPNFLATHFAAIAQHPEVLVSTGNILMVHEQSSEPTLFGARGFLPAFAGRPHFVLARPLLTLIALNIFPLLQGTLIRRDVLLQTRLFDPKLAFAEDLELIGQIGLRGPFLFIATPVARVLRRIESIPNMTAQLATAAIFSRDCVHSIYEGILRSGQLNAAEELQLRRITSQNQRSMGNLCVQAGRGREARNYYRGALVTDRSFAAFVRFLLSFLPTAIQARTIKKAHGF